MRNTENRSKEYHVADDEHVAIVRLAGEVTIKAPRTQHAFRQRLVHNIHDALKSTGEPYEVHAERHRIIVRARSEEAIATLTRVFGVANISVIDAVAPAELDEIVRVGRETFSDRVRGRSYAVRARRAGEHDFRSADILVELGAALNEEATVDLDDPDVTVHVDVRPDEAWLSAERRQGSTGLPVGVEGNAVALLSGGFDSPVAAWLMLKRGVTLDYVFCNLGGDAYERAVVQVGKILADTWSYGTRPRLHIVDFAEPLEELRQNVAQRYWQIILKRMMYRAASQIGHELRAQVIVTGEAIGQVSSQTLHNLRAIEPAASLPVFRPLLGFDKNEIIEHAEKIGTATISAKVREYCAIAPGQPATAATVSATDDEESKIDLSVIERAVSDRKVLDLRALETTDLVAPYVFTSEVPDDAIVIDCREPAQYEAWHWPGAERHDEWTLARDFKRLDRDQHYVLYCAYGVQTAHLAELMQREGYEAYSFKGGVRALQKYAETKDDQEAAGATN